MIRIQLIREGRVVKQITSRVHESVILEQINKYDESFDTISILEGELSEDAKSILQKVAKKIVPAAMAAGVAMSGAHAQGGANPNYPGLDRSVGQHVADIFSPNYKEIVRQRNYERETQRREWDAQQNEIRRARVDAARAAGRQQTGATNHKIYDQSRVSQDGRYFILYGMDDSITRVPTKGSEFMPADSQRLAHYISANGQIYYVRHPHNNGLGESTVAEDIGTIGTVGTIPASGASSMTKKTEFNKTAGTTDVKFNAQGQLELDDEEFDDEQLDTLKKAGVKVAESEYRMHPDLVKIINANKEDVEKFKATGELTPDLESDLHYHYYDQLSMQAQRDADDEGEIATLFAEDLGIDLAKIFEGSAIDPKLTAILDQYADSYAAFKAGGDLDDNVDFYEALFAYFSDLGPEDGMPYGTQKARDGDPIQWIADKLDKLSGVEPMGESQLNEYLVQRGDKATALLDLNLFTDLDPQEGLSAQYDDFAADPRWQAVVKQYSPIAAALAKRLTAHQQPLTPAEANAIDDTWYDGSDAYDDVEVEYLVNVYDNQIDKIEALLAGNLTDEEFGESVEDDEASAADIAGADKNIIMQIRKAKDYEKPTVLELGDGSTVRIDSNIASKMLAQFDRLRPDSKALMQQTLNTAEGFREMLNYFNEREVLESMADIDLISNHMKPVLEARQRARNLVKSVFGKV